jgi:hypothetical protein
VRRTELALLLALVLSALWRWGPTVVTPTVLPDESVYVNAARHLEAGRSPYAEPTYFYPPPVATFVQRVSPHLGEVGALRILRAAALAGIVLTVLLSLRCVPWHWLIQLTIGVLFIWFAPAVRLATELGNVAGLAIGLALFGLIAWNQRPVVAGLALGIGLAIKPVAPLAPLLLALHRPAEPTRRHLVTTIVAAAAGIAACASGLRYLPDLLGNADHPTNPYNFSVQKVLTEAGLQVPSLSILLLAGVAALLFMRRQGTDQHDFLNVTVTSSLIALPILWALSLLLILPIQLLALNRCGCVMGAWRVSTRRDRLELVVAVLAILSTVFSHAVGTTFGIPPWGSAIIRIVPLFSIAYLGWFVFTTRNREPRRDALPD